MKISKSDLLDCPTLDHKQGEPLPMRLGKVFSPYKVRIDGREYRVFYRLVVRLPSGEQEVTID
jgi:hypothetical protein